MGLYRHALALFSCVVLVLCGALGTSLASAAPLVLVAPGSDTPDARRAASELAATLVTLASIQEVDVLPQPSAAFARGGVSVVVVVDATPEAYSLRAFAADGRSWAPRPVARSGPSAVVSEHVASAGRSIVAALLEPRSPSSGAASAPSSSAASAPSAPSSSAPLPPAPLPPSPALSPSAASPAPSSPVSDHAPEAPDKAAPVAPPPYLRIEGAFAGANVAPELAFHPGASVGAFWLRSPVQFGAIYTFFPGAPVDTAGTSIVLARHTVALGVRADLRFSRWALAGTLGPMLEVWSRSTRSVGTGATASPSSTQVSPAAFARVDGTLWLFSGVGLTLGLGLEVAPSSPHFRGPDSQDVLTPNVLRARGDLGLVGEFR